MARVLWVEDEADGQLAEYVQPVLMAGHDVDVVNDVSDAARRLQEDRYDVVIVDLIINVGYSNEWREYEQNARGDRFEQYLGFALLRALFKKEPGLPAIEPKHSIAPSRVAVFSVVSNLVVLDCIREMGVTRIWSKVSSPITALLDIVEETLEGH